MEKKHGGHYTFKGQDERPLSAKIIHSLQRPLKILFTQPIVFTMAAYGAVIFAVTYSLFTNMQSIFSEEPHNFSTLQVGLLYIGPGSGYIIGVWFLVPWISTIFNNKTAKNNGVSKPEFRLPLANIGAVLLPLSLFWFAWTIEYRFLLAGANAIYASPRHCPNLHFQHGAELLYRCVRSVSCQRHCGR